MGDQSDEPLPPGVQSNFRSNSLFPLGISDARKADAGEEAFVQPHENSNSSNVQYESYNDFEAAAQTAVLHEQVLLFLIVLMI